MPLTKNFINLKMKLHSRSQKVYTVKGNSFHALSKKKYLRVIKKKPTKFMN